MPRRRGPVPPTLLGVAGGQEGLATAAQCDARGLDADRRARLVRSGDAVQVTRGVLDLGPVLGLPPVAERDHDSRRRWTARLGLAAAGPAGVALGTSALVLLGVQGVPVTARAHVGLPTGVHRRDRDGVRFQVVDPRLPTVVVGGARVALADGRAQSPLETRARLQCVDAGVAPDELQVPVHDPSGRCVALGDLGWWLPDGRLLVAEIDGRGPHGTAPALYEDRRRQNVIAAVGHVTLLRFTSADVASGTVAPTVASHISAPARRRTVASWSYRGR